MLNRVRDRFKAWRKRPRWLDNVFFDKTIDRLKSSIFIIILATLLTGLFYVLFSMLTGSIIPIVDWLKGLLVPAAAIGSTILVLYAKLALITHDSPLSRLIWKHHLDRMEPLMDDGCFVLPKHDGITVVLTPVARRIPGTAAAAQNNLKRFAGHEHDKRVVFMGAASKRELRTGLEFNASSTDYYGDHYQILALADETADVDAKSLKKTVYLILSEASPVDSWYRITDYAESYMQRNIASNENLINNGFGEELDDMRKDLNDWFDLQNSIKTLNQTPASYDAVNNWLQSADKTVTDAATIFMRSYELCDLKTDRGRILAKYESTIRTVIEQGKTVRDGLEELEPDEMRMMREASKHLSDSLYQLKTEASQTAEDGLS